MSEEKNGPVNDPIGSVAGKIAEMIEGVMANLRELVGPLSEKEEGEIKAVLAYQATSVLIERLHTMNRIGHGRVESDD